MVGKGSSNAAPRLRGRWLWHPQFVQPTKIAGPPTHEEEGGEESIFRERTKGNNARVKINLVKKKIILSHNHKDADKTVAQPKFKHVSAEALPL